MTIGIRSNLIVSLKKKNDNSFYFNFFFFLLSVFHWYKRKSWKNTNIEGYFHFSSKWQLVLCQLFRYVCFTGQMSENLSTVIKSCRANFGVKWRVLFSTSIFVQKCQFWAKIIEVLWEMLTFWNYCALLLKVDILLENMLIFRKFWLFVWMSLYIKKLSKYDKNFNFS